MIGVDNSYLFDIEIGNFRDFVSFEDKLYFNVNEYAGGILPDFNLKFFTNNPKIKTVLHEGTLIKAKLGRTYNSLDDLFLYCTSSDSVELGDQGEFFNVSGFVAPLKYVMNPTSAIYNKSAVAAVLEVAGKYFKKIESNITTSFDTQKWVQPYKTNKEFISKTIYRADLGASFPAIAITMDGKFILKDILKDKKTDPVWNFTRIADPSKSNNITYLGDAPLSSNNGIINAILGRNFNFASYILETEEKVTQAITSKNVLANTERIGGIQDLADKKLAGIMQTENVHANYNKSYYQNITNLLNLSRFEVFLTTDGVYYKIRPLDKVYFAGRTIDTTAPRNSSSDTSSGQYYVTQTSRTIQNRLFYATVKLNRESPNGVQP